MVRNISATMEALNLESHLNNPMLVRELVDKLSNHHKLAWEMHRMTPGTAIVREFSDWLYNIAEAASKVTPPIYTKKSGCINMHNRR